MVHLLQLILAKLIFETSLSDHLYFLQRCDQTLETIPEIVPLEEGFRFVAVCPAHCIISPEGRVFGSGPFAPSSTICTVGIYTGLCSTAEDTTDTCNFLILVGGAKTLFKQGTAHGVTAISHGPSEASFTAIKAPCEEDEAQRILIKFGGKPYPEVNCSHSIRSLPASSTLTLMNNLIKHLPHRAGSLMMGL